jgi:Zn-finger nucleic acid-binding protein
MNITNQPRYIAGVRHDYCPGCRGYIHPLNECECAVEQEPAEPMTFDTYKIIRFYKDAGIRRRTIKRGLTLDEARAHCKEAETSWDRPPRHRRGWREPGE